MRYKQNLQVIGNDVLSYKTKVGLIDWTKKELKILGYWSMTTSKHINHVANEYGLTKTKA
mgnify:CR=1 FL=1